MTGEDLNSKARKMTPPRKIPKVITNSEYWNAKAEADSRQYLDEDDDEYSPLGEAIFKQATGISFDEDDDSDDDDEDDESEDK
jgi:hypothetical protein